MPDRSDKGAVCAYLNDEIKRHVQGLYDQREKSQQAYAAEKTRIRRQIRQEQSERAKNAKAEKTKVQIDEEKEEALQKLKEQREQEVDTVQLELAERMNEALHEEGDEEMEEGASEVISASNVSSYLSDGHTLQEVVEQMVDKLKTKGKSVKDFNTP